MLSEISISILCGGSAKRFKSNKALHELNGKSIIEIIYETLNPFTNDIFLQGAESTLIREVKTYLDIIKNKGPLGGVYSALTNAKYQKIFVTACDTPFIDKRILKELIKHKEYDIVVPKWDTGYYEPLCALYSKSLTPIIKAQLDKQHLKITEIYEHANTKAVSIERLVEEGRLGRDCFKNINFPEDLMD